MSIVNYIVRGFIILVGIAIIIITFVQPVPNDSFLKLLGVVCILFGTYRLLMYHTKMKNYNFDKNDETK